MNSEAEFGISRDTFYKYRRNVMKELKKNNLSPKDLSTLTNKQIEEICNNEYQKEEINITTNKELNEQKNTKENEKNVLNDMYEDLNEKVQIVEIKEENKETENIKDDEIDIEERESKKNILKWGLIVGGVVIVILSILIFYKNKNKITTKTSNNNIKQTETKPKKLEQNFWQEQSYNVEEY